MSLAGRTVSGAKTKGLSPQEEIAYLRRQAANGPTSVPPATRASGQLGTRF
jgi:hypothetical protein